MSTEFESGAGRTAERPDVELALTVVRYSDAPDRCTLHPPDASGQERLTRWLSADTDAFVDLATRR
jgi:hypothetical protein